MDNSKRGSIPMQVDLHLNKSQCATTSAEMKRFEMQNVPIMFQAVGSIIKLNTKDTFLVYDGNPEAELQVKCYCDAGFETDRDDTKSQTGYVFVLNGGAVVWKSSKQSTTAQHATEAEYIAASEAAKEVVWIRKFIDELGVVPSNDYPIKMNYDNSAAITSHIRIRIKKAPYAIQENIIMEITIVTLVEERCPRGKVASRGWSFASVVPGYILYTKEDFHGIFCLACYLLIGVIVDTVVIVVVISVVVVVAIVGVVVVVVGSSVSSIIKLSFPLCFQAASTLSATLPDDNQ
ncbi:hypothetical protein Tco_0337320 [Tanacetum coccineum]